MALIKLLGKDRSFYEKKQTAIKFILSLPNHIPYHYLSCTYRSHIQSNSYNSSDSEASDTFPATVSVSGLNNSPYSKNVQETNIKDSLMKSLNLDIDEEEVLVNIAFSGKIYNGEEEANIESIEKQRGSTDNMVKELKKLQDSCEVSSLRSKIKGLQRVIMDTLWTDKELNSIFQIHSSNIQSTPNGLHLNMMNQLHNIVRRLGYDEFRKPQDKICFQAVTSNDDIVCIAPTGFGKSLSFIVPACFRGGITLVIEPLKAIIFDQVSKMKQKSINSEHLMSMKDAAEKCGIHAHTRLAQIAHRIEVNRNIKEELILYATPELVEQESILNQLVRIQKCGKLTRIVFDEFDVSAENYRSVYDRILPTLSERLPNIPLMFLSATSEGVDLVHFIKSLPRSKVKKPHLFLCCKPLADSLSFSVERKKSHKQVSFKINSDFSVTIDNNCF